MPANPEARPDVREGSPPANGTDIAGTVAVVGTVVVVGTGLIGCSVAWALARAGRLVHLIDTDKGHARMAFDLIAAAGLEPRLGPPAPEARDAVDVVVVATPPRRVADVISASTRLYPTATVMDVASVKAHVQRHVESSDADLSRVVLGHPLAGRASNGPAQGSPDLFRGRVWALCGLAANVPASRDRAAAVVRLCGAAPVWLDALDHDGAVAVTSHLPQLLASGLAAVLDGRSRVTDVAGPAAHDMTRVAASPAGLWAEIVAANRGPVRNALAAFDAALTGVRDALDAGDDVALAGEVTALLARGRRGRAGLAAKHPGLDAPVPAGVEPARAATTTGTAGLTVTAVTEGAVTGAASPAVQAGAEPGPAPGPSADPGSADLGRRAFPSPVDDDGWAWVQVVVEDRPGALMRLFAAAGSAGVNIEDVRLEHAPAQATGVALLAVDPADVGALRSATGGH